MADVEIRLAVEKDANAIAEILSVALAEFRNDYTPEAYAIVTPLAEEIRGRFVEGPMWVAVRDGQLSGTVSAVREPEWLYIRSMAVVPDAQGFGIGKRLMTAVEQYGIENGFDTLFLYTTGFSAGAIRLYESLGFRKDRDTTAEEWYGTPGLSMLKKIGRNIENAFRS
ncbi:MAG: GNAT family N-acetyltransferase [Acidobacteriota bacterium]